MHASMEVYVDMWVAMGSTCVCIHEGLCVSEGVYVHICVCPCLNPAVDLCLVFIQVIDRRWGSVEELEDALDGHLGLPHASLWEGQLVI